MVVGMWFAKSILTKLGFVLVGGFFPLPAASARWQAVMPKLIAKYAADNPFPWYKHFLLDTVFPSSHVFRVSTMRPSRTSTTMSSHAHPQPRQMESWFKGRGSG